MKNWFPTCLLFTAFTAVAAPAVAGDDPFGDDGDKRTVLAVFGDWPYSKALLDGADNLLKSVNDDKDVSWVVHVGDIHSGSMACTSANIHPPIADSFPDWNQNVFAKFQQFKSPVIYTPGDNEWTDCHKGKEFQSGAPLKELDSVRSLFFSRPGFTLGLKSQPVFSQNKYFDARYPDDKKYVENVIWRDGKTVFVTLNMPGSNNDGLPWNGAPKPGVAPSSTFLDETARAAEQYARTQADIRWLTAAFSYASLSHAKALAIFLQADMWDLAQLPPGGDGLGNYTEFVAALANLSVGFGKPVLLVNGDSHCFKLDHPLADPSSATGVIHGLTYSVPNLTRITVQGSTNPTEWVRLVADTRTPGVFTAAEVKYAGISGSVCPLP